MTIQQLIQERSIPEAARQELIMIAQLRLELHELQVMYNSGELHNEDVRIRIEEIQSLIGHL